MVEVCPICYAEMESEMIVMKITYANGRRKAILGFKDKCLRCGFVKYRKSSLQPSFLILDGVEYEGEGESVE